MKIQPKTGGIKINSLYHIVFTGWSNDIDDYKLEFKSNHLFSKNDQIKVEINGKMVWVEFLAPEIIVHANGIVKYHYSLITK